MKWTWMLPFNLSTPPPSLLWDLRDSWGSWREASIHNTAALRTHHALLLMMVCHAWRPCSPSGSCNPLGCSRAEEIPFHIKHSWGGLLTWILLSASWLKLPLLPNYTRPRWLLPWAGVRTSGAEALEKSLRLVQLKTIIVQSGSRGSIEERNLSEAVLSPSSFQGRTGYFSWLVCQLLTPAHCRTQNIETTWQQKLKVAAIYGPIARCQAPRRI